MCGQILRFGAAMAHRFAAFRAVGMRDHVFDHFRENPVGYGSTYFAHPVCCAAAYATLKHILKTNLGSHVRSMAVTAEALLDAVGGVWLQ